MFASKHLLKYYLTDDIFETGAYGVPSKSQNPTVLGEGDPSSTQLRHLWFGNVVLDGADWTLGTRWWTTLTQTFGFCDLLGTPYAPVSKIPSVKDLMASPYLQCPLCPCS